MGKGKCAPTTHMNAEARGVKCWSSLEIFCEVIAMFWFILSWANGYDNGTGWWAAFLSMIAYSIFACCQPNDNGLKTMISIVTLSGVMRFVSFILLCTFLGNIDKWSYKCQIKANINCWNSGIQYNDGLTECYTAQTKCENSEDTTCSNTENLYSAKFRLCK